MKVAQIFEDELTRRGMRFEIDSESGRYSVSVGQGKCLVSLENLARDYERLGDPGCVSLFVDTVANTAVEAATYALENLYWALEPNDYVEKPDILEPMSGRVDRVLVHLSSDSRRITWVNDEILRDLGVSRADASQIGFDNLAKALAEATVEFSEIEEVRLGMIDTRLPFKTALILAPNIREIVEDKLGWPLMAITPDRDFLYLWASRHSDFVGRVGSVVVKEYSKAAYPITTEVFEITEKGIEAIGEFPV